MSKALLASVFALAAAVPVLSLSGCSPEVPANPTYSEHVKPIFMARCVRCHDETLRDEVPPPGYPARPRLPQFCHLNRYDSEPIGCTPATPPCSLGASACVNIPGMGGYLAARVDPAVEHDAARMPPAPAPALNDYESAVVNRWLTNLDANGAPLP
jgi:hypothetical protein